MFVKSSVFLVIENNHPQGGAEPDWVLTEREHFTKFRDRNGDGVMDLDEVGSANFKVTVTLDFFCLVFEAPNSNATPD